MSQVIPTPICHLSGQLANKVCVAPGCAKPPFICRSCQDEDCLKLHQHGGLMQIRGWVVISETIEGLDGAKKNEDEGVLERASEKLEGFVKGIQNRYDKFAEGLAELRKGVKYHPQEASVINELKDRKYENITGDRIHKFLQNKLSQSQIKQTQLTNAEIDRRCNQFLKLIDLLSKTIDDFDRQQQIHQKASMLYEEAVRSIRNKDLQAAERALNGAIELDKKNVKCLEQRAELLIQKEKFDEALGDITRVLEIDPARREAHFMRGLVLFHRKEYEAAIKSLDLAIQADQNPKYFEKRGNCYLELRRYQKALSDYSSVLERRRTAWDYLNRSAVLTLLKLTQAAQADSEEGFRLLDVEMDSYNTEPKMAYAFDRQMHLEAEDIRKDREERGCQPSSYREKVAYPKFNC